MLLTMPGDGLAVSDERANYCVRKCSIKKNKTKTDRDGNIREGVSGLNCQVFNIEIHQ